MLAQMREQHPELAQAAQSDPPRFAQLLRDLQSVDKYDQQLERQRQINALNDDPFDIEAQRKIEEMIQQEQVLENLNNAMEYHPESFGQVTMLYIDVEVNGHKVKAFVDSGAQATIMSPQCAEKCGIMRLIDKRFAGVAHGVGTANILGRVHSAQVKVGSLFLLCSFTIMEGGAAGRAGPDMLFGLDMLKRHQACINLSTNRLQIGDASVPFLGEHELPDSARDTSRTIDGPSNTKLDATTGAVVDNKAAQKFSGSGTVLGGTTSTSTSTRSDNNASKVAQLEAMGFAKAECVQALEATNGDVDMAAGLLL